MLVWAQTFTQSILPYFPWWVNFFLSNVKKHKIALFNYSEHFSITHIQCVFSLHPYPEGQQDGKLKLQNTNRQKEKKNVVRLPMS